MQWFKHQTNAASDPVISDAEDEFGDAGYSVYFKILEIYGTEFNSLEDGQTLNVSLTFLRRKLRKSWTKVEQILSFYQANDKLFFEKVEKRVHIRIPKFIEISSNWTKRAKAVPTEAPAEVPTAKEEKRIEEKRIEEIQLSEKSPAFSKDSSEFQLANFLASKILSRAPGFKNPNLQTWAKQIDLMIRVDKRAPIQIEQVISWCQSDPFWQTNILSTSKLRKQFDQLVGKMNQPQTQYGGKLTGQALHNELVDVGRRFIENDSI